MKSKGKLVKEVIKELEPPFTLGKVKEVFEKKEEAYGREISKVWIKEKAQEIEGFKVEQTIYKGTVYNVIIKEDQDKEILDEFIPNGHKNKKE